MESCRRFHVAADDVLTRASSAGSFARKHRVSLSLAGMRNASHSPKRMKNAVMNAIPNTVCIVIGA